MPIQESLFGKMSTGPSTPTKELTSGSSSTKWLKQGRWSSNGECWMHDLLGYPSEGGECSLSLSSILLPPEDVLPKYFLSRHIKDGMLRRGLDLDPLLREKLEHGSSRAIPARRTATRPGRRQGLHPPSFAQTDTSDQVRPSLPLEWTSGD